MNIEPVGSKAPTFSTASKSSTFIQNSGVDLALLCQVQAFPVPLIRYDLNNTSTFCLTFFRKHTKENGNKDRSLYKEEQK